MTTFPLYQPAPFGLLVVAPLSVGAVLSMSMLPTVAVAELSALSTAVPVTDWFAPLAVFVVGPLHDLMPETLSEQVKLTVTSVLFQPFAFAAGLREPVTVGVCLSSLIVTDPVPL